MKKSFESFTKKMTKKFLERKDRERNRRDRQKELLKKSDLIPICFWKSKFNWSRGIRQESNFTWKQARSIERNRVGIKGTQDFKLEIYFYSSHFNRSKNRLDRSNSKGTKILKNSRNFFLQNHLKNCFYDMTCMFMTSNIFQNQTFQRKIETLYQISSIFSFLTPQNALNTLRSLILEGHKT